MPAVPEKYDVSILDPITRREILIAKGLSKSATQALVRASVLPIYAKEAKK